MHKEVDPYLLPAFSLKNRFARQIWNLAWLLLYRPSPKILFSWRSALLRFFGAKLGKKCVFHQTSKIWAPWNLVCEDAVAVGEDVILYNPSNLYIGSHAIISQGAFLCGASHDHNDAAFPLFSKSIYVGPYAWICARASVLPGITLGEGSVLGMASVATKDLENWHVYVGNPCKVVANRRQNNWAGNA